jgi:four helix bundle protein
VARSDFENLQVYRLAERLADSMWRLVGCSNGFDKHTLGKQLVRAADSIGANIAEGAGRGSYQDNRRFVRIARGSLYETKHWLRRAYVRELIGAEAAGDLRPLLDELAPRLNACLKSIGETELAGEKQLATDNWPLTTDH